MAISTIKIGTIGGPRRRILTSDATTAALEAITLEDTMAETHFLDAELAESLLVGVACPHV